MSRVLRDVAEVVDVDEVLVVVERRSEWVDVFVSQDVLARLKERGVAISNTVEHGEWQP